MRKQDRNKDEETKERGSKSKNLFQIFFEKAIGPQETPRKVKKKKKIKKKEVVPRVTFNPMVAMLGTQPKGMNFEKEFIALPHTILKIDNNHFTQNKILENKELFSKSKLDYMDIKSLLSLDYDKGWQYKIILEGGLLLCFLRQIHKERDNLVKHIKDYIRREVKERRDSLEELQELANNVTPIDVQYGKGEDMQNPIIQIFIDTLYKEIKRIKEAFHEAREKAFKTEE